MIALILSLFLISSPISVDAAPVMIQEQLIADIEEADPAPADQEDPPVDAGEDDLAPADQEDPPADAEEDGSDPVDQEDLPADQEDPPANPKQQKDVIKEYEHITTYQMVSVEADPVASDTLDYLEYAEESYYLLSMICAILLFFLVICICKYIYRFFDIFI